jgi:acetylornithine/succinyldiaminopimelate/putrescine aminotransferase
LAATGQSDLQEGFGPMPAGFVHVEPCNAAAVADAVGPHTAAVLVEPIIGEGGVLVPPDGYLAALREACDAHGALLILDEVQSGWGRTGTLYAHEGDGIKPDIIASAKGMAGGLPIGAVLATEEAAAAFVPGTHGSTFGGNPVSCRAALAVLEIFDSERVLENCRRSGEHLASRLTELAERRGDVIEVRGRGLMRGMELNRPARPVVAAALEQGVVLNATAGSVVRFLPPLTVTTTEIDEGIDVLEAALARTEGNGPQGQRKPR